MGLTKEEQLQHALHNEEVCNHLFLKDNFTDWVITTAFYSSLKFVSFKIFPFDYSPRPDSPKITISSVDDLARLKESSDKHKILVDLVYQHCPAIGPEYDDLLSMSFRSRYAHYQYGKEYANKARSQMILIKNFCTAPPTPQKQTSTEKKHPSKRKL